LEPCPAVRFNLFSNSFFCKNKKELPLVAFFISQKIVVSQKGFPLPSGLVTAKPNYLILITDPFSFFGRRCNSIFVNQIIQCFINI
jgi:hypothetical protein